jgi:adenosylcobinamide-GDP ribazoletransferase
MRHIFNAFSVLTRLPVRQTDKTDAPWAGISGWFPLVGAIVGIPAVLLATLAVAAGAGGHAPLPTAVVVVALGVAMSGGMHLDGWTGCCDAFFVPGTRERRLQIMADPHTGRLGIIGLTLILLLKVTAVAHLVQGAATPDGPLTVLYHVWPIVAAPVIGRWALALLIHATRIPLAPEAGAAAEARQGLTQTQLLLATATAAIFVAPLDPTVAAGALIAAALALPLLAGLAVRRIGGLTDDVFGAATELTETLALVAACLI